MSFDRRSFSLGDIDGKPAVTFVVPGVGDHATGTTLPLDPIPATPPAWWSSVAPTLPSSRDSVEDRWAGKGYSIRARYDATGESAALSLADSTGREWALGRIPVPVRHVLWLDAPALDSLHREALARAFDDAVLYDDNARVARRRDDRRLTAPPVRAVSRRLPHQRRAARLHAVRTRHPTT
jgi:hypothetical protein